MSRKAGHRNEDYAEARKQVREILESHSQAQRIMEAKDMWESLTCYPIPPLRTIRRYMEQVRKESEIGRHGQNNQRAA